MSESWSVDEQKEICERIGYNVDDWNPEDSNQSRKLRVTVLNAITSGVDKNKKPISYDDYRFLFKIIA